MMPILSCKQLLMFKKRNTENIALKKSRVKKSKFLLKRRIIISLNLEKWSRNDIKITRSTMLHSMITWNDSEIARLNRSQCYSLRVWTVDEQQQRLISGQFHTQRCRFIPRTRTVCSTTAAQMTRRRPIEKINSTRMLLSYMSWIRLYGR